MRKIQSFKDENTETIYNGLFSKSFLSEIQSVALRKLIMIDNSDTLNDLRIPPGNHLEALSGNRIGQYSIRINDKYRICFREVNNYYIDVEIVDYH